ncbi:MAG: type VI secretion system-associated protein TagF [Rhodospirillaceae bacterium]|nr:type VI secretion system-associated protein TagF [Rhodospirillaceae bacterium]
MTDLAESGTAGFYGKVPVKGDFVSHRLPRSFLDAWDPWLQAAIAQSRAHLHDAWLDTYLTSPVWSFALSAGVCGPVPVAGVMMPSVDRVGRYFPFVLAALLPDCDIPAALPQSGRQWFQRLEELALTSLEDRFELAGFDQRLQALGLPGYPRRQDPGMPGGTETVDPRHGGLTVALGPSADALAAYPDLVHHIFAAARSEYSLWWTTGSDRVPPCLVTALGLPPEDAFTAFFDGRWRYWGWGGRYPHALPGVTAVGTSGHGG